MTDKGMKWLMRFKSQFKKDFGPKCKDYYWSCFVCEGWRMIEALEDLYDLEGKIQHKTRYKTGEEK